MDQSSEQEKPLSPEQLKEQILKEIEEFKIEFPEAPLATYFENFAFNLPDPRNPLGGTNRDKMQLFYDIPIGDRATPENSEIYKKQTPREFFETVDQIIKEENTPLDKLHQIQQLITEEGSKHYEELYELVTPVYIKLRQMGYNNEDLTR